MATSTSGNVVGFTTLYDLRRTKNVWMRASYTFSSPKERVMVPTPPLAWSIPACRTCVQSFHSASTSATASKGTVDFRYGEGTDYNGPMLFGKKILQRTGVNFVANLGSGTPCSHSSSIYNEGENRGTYTLDGTLNGATPRPAVHHRHGDRSGHPADLR
ncbi:MAG: hypothetical protein IPL86_11880 [Flavobacteriales bacterium]|nr:hypothetical protein [Flavobacteriales bacterium]